MNNVMTVVVPKRLEVGGRYPVTVLNGEAKQGLLTVTPAARDSQVLTITVEPAAAAVPAVADYVFRQGPTVQMTSELHDLLQRHRDIVESGALAAEVGCARSAISRLAEAPLPVRAKKALLDEIERVLGRRG